jgi:hypothetical protein
MSRDIKMLFGLLSIYWTVLMCMKVQILKNVLVEVEKTRLGEVWDKQLSRWDELNVEKIDVQGKWAFLTDFNGDVYINVPVDAFKAV